jgi:hypothetical protein
MLSNDSAEPLQQASPLRESEAGAAPASSPLPDPRRPIETSTGGNGTVNDPSATDTKPPGIDDFELFA